MNVYMLSIILLGIVGSIVAVVYAHKRQGERFFALLGVATVNEKNLKEVLLRLATVSAAVSNMRADLIRIELQTTNGATAMADVGRVLEKLPGAMDAIRGSVKGALEKLEENEIPLEISRPHEGALARVQQARHFMAEQEEASWREFLQTVNAAKPKEP